MAAITPQERNIAGAAITFAGASGGGDTVKIDDDRTELLVRNGSGSSINVTLTAVKAMYGKTLANTVVAVAAGAIARIPLISDLYRNPSGGTVAVAYSAVTTVDVAAIR